MSGSAGTGPPTGGSRPGDPEARGEASRRAVHPLLLAALSGLIVHLAGAGAVRAQEEPIDPAAIPEEVDHARLPEMTLSTVFVREDETLKMIDIERREITGSIDVSLNGYLPIVVPYDREVFAYATEQFHTRGTRGEVVSLVSVFGYDGHVSEEVIFPQPQMVSVDISRGGENLYYYNAVDETIWRIGTDRMTLDEPVYVGATCGAQVFAVGRSRAFTTCWSQGEMVEVDYAGSDPRLTRHRVFPAGAELYRTHARIRDEEGRERIFLFTRRSEVIPIRFDADGVPLESDPVSLRREGEIIAPRGEGYAISPDGERAFVSYRDGEEYKSPGERVRVFETEDWEEVMEIVTPDEIREMAVTLDGRWLVTAGNERISIFDAETYRFRGFYEELSPGGLYVPRRLFR